MKDTLPPNTTSAQVSEDTTMKSAAEKESKDEVNFAVILQ